MCIQLWFLRRDLWTYSLEFLDLPLHLLSTDLAQPLSPRTHSPLFGHSGVRSSVEWSEPGPPERDRGVTSFYSIERRQWLRSDKKGLSKQKLNLSQFLCTKILSLDNHPDDSSFDKFQAPSTGFMVRVTHIHIRTYTRTIYACIHTHASQKFTRVKHGRGKLTEARLSSSGDKLWVNNLYGDFIFPCFSFTEARLSFSCFFLVFFIVLLL